MDKNEYVIISEGQSSQRPSNPYEGYQYWNEQTNRLEVYRDGYWKNVYTTPGGEVLEGSEYSCKISNEEHVFMGGVDITSSVVSDGVVTISEVTGDVEIRIVSTPEPPTEENNEEPTEGE